MSKLKVPTSKIQTSKSRDDKLKRKIILTICFTMILFLSGCWDVSEPQRMYYVHGVGVDFKDNKYEVYIQLINFADVAKSETPSPETTPSEIGHAKGDTMEEAIYNIYRSVDQEIFWGHMTYAIFTEEVLKSEHAISVIDSFLRFRETRYQIFAHCTKDSLEEILLITPLVNKPLTSSKLSSPLNTKALETFIEPIDLRSLIIGLNEPSHEVALSLVSINESWESKNEKPAKETSVNGNCILSKDGFKGTMKGNTARGTQWMLTKKNRGDITIKVDDSERDYLTLDLEKIDLDVKPIVKNNQVTFEIDIKFNATLNGFKTKVTSDEIRKGIIKKVKEEIKTTYEEGLKLDVDIYRLSEYLYRDKVKVWKKIENDGKIPLTKESISKINVYVNKVNPGRKTFEETIVE